ncbi:MAG: UDP-N-acetylmuramate dehydrogenase [Dehalococcoidales bacterium]|nr:UDP-N-acetylmuramate dehydrogenase [Dehalococcoidales bacterium]
MRQDLLSDIQNRLGRDRVKVSEPLSQHTTYRVGGPADLFYEAQTVDELVHAVKLARSLHVPFFILGLGANILVGDKGIRGLVVKNRCAGIEFKGRGRVVAESGAVVADLIEQTKAGGLSGLEHFAGIPSTVGGALWQNLHFLAPDRNRTVFVEEVLLGATILTEEGDVIEVGKDYFSFGYDESVLHHRKDVVLKAAFELVPASVADIQQIVDENLRWRAEKHPDLRQFPSAGSVFRQIEGLGAGRLIDQCGLKGFTIGRAQVSPKHANFIVNLGGASASDVVQLIQLCKEKVKERFGAELTEEIRMVGEFCR